MDLVFLIIMRFSLKIGDSFLFLENNFLENGLKSLFIFVLF